MNAAEIRVEAIDRIARSTYAAWKHQYDMFERAVGSTAVAPEYDDDAHRWPERESAIHAATRAVDALGDLLPTRTQWAVAWTDDRYGTRERQDASIECRDDAERFRHQYNDDAYPELSDVRVEHRYLTDWTVHA